MVFYSEIEKSFLLTKYFETKSYKKVKSAFSGKFNKSAPNDSLNAPNDTLVTF